jgi:hypothetical protein
MITWQRIVYYMGLALIEATPPALLLTLAGGNVWGLLIGVALVGALADWILLRRLPPHRQPLALGGVGLLCALWLAKVQVVGDYGLLGDWGQALAALFSISHPRAGIAYLSLLTALYCFWRGTRITLQDGASIHRVFRAVSVSLLLIVGLGLFGAGRTDPIMRSASTQVLIFFAVGLVTVALASATEDRGVGLRRLGWRGILILCGSVALVLVPGLLAGALVGSLVGQIISTVWEALALILLLMFVPLLELLFGLLEWLVNTLHLGQMFSQFVQQLQQRNQQRPALPENEALAGFPVWVQAAIRTFFALLPILLMLGLLLLARSRQRRQNVEDEERESLWSWSGLAADLRGLLTSWRRPPSDGGLRAALSRLRGGDPVHRIRRSYIRLLLIGETHSQPRGAQQTPREYAATASAMLPSAAEPVTALTDAYERARYYPAGATDADAEAAERAWEAIDRAERRPS